MASPRITKEEQALLDAIAVSESAGDWNVIYGGQKFDDYSQHPRQYVTIKSGPNEGKKSSAAGKYQILASTYDRVAPKLGITDFSPESQQRIALELAREKYGPNLAKDLMAGKAADVARNLGGVWTSLPGGIEAGTTDNRFLSAYNSALGSSNPALNAIQSAAPSTQQQPGIGPRPFGAPAPLTPRGGRFMDFTGAPNRNMGMMAPTPQQGGGGNIFGNLFGYAAEKGQQALGALGNATQTVQGLPAAVKGMAAELGPQMMSSLPMRSALISGLMRGQVEAQRNHVAQTDPMRGQRIMTQNHGMQTVGTRLNGSPRGYTVTGDAFFDNFGRTQPENQALENSQGAQIRAGYRMNPTDGTLIKIRGK